MYVPVNDYFACEAGKFNVLVIVRKCFAGNISNDKKANDNQKEQQNEDCGKNFFQSFHRLPD